MLETNWQHLERVMGLMMHVWCQNEELCPSTNTTDFFILKFTRIVGIVLELLGY